MKYIALLSTVGAVGAFAQSGPWVQCGGKGWTGPSTCVDGYTCKYSNDYYSQCVPGSNQPTSTGSAPSTHPTGPGNTGALKWLGVDESVAEFGDGKFPGVWGVDFSFPDEAAIGTLISEGFNIFRVPFSMERMAPGSITGPFSSAYLANFTHVVEYITSHGAWAVVDPHNYGRYNGNVVTDVSSFKSFWTKLATVFKANDKVIFDTNNEYHDMDQSLVLQLNQGAIDAIRAAGATSQYIFAEGNSYSGAWTWKQTNDNLKDLKDPQGKLVYEMHQYLDSDGSGKSETCVSSTIGAERVASATQWLRDNGKVGVLGEFAGGANAVCRDAVTGLLDHLKENGDVWMGAVWWSAGPWWGNYIYSFEPPSGIGYQYYDGLLRQYVPG